MAYKRVVLPSLKLTQRSTCGKKKVEYLYRGVPESESVLQVENPSRASSGNTVFCAPQSSIQSEAQLASQEVVSFPTVSEPTTYEIDSKSSVIGWETVRARLLNAVVEAAAMPLNQACIHCDTKASLKCKQCSPIAYYCNSCFKGCHTKTNFLHVAEKWEVCFSNSGGSVGMQLIQYFLCRMVILCHFHMETLKLRLDQSIIVV